jgi:hypothetical protein
MSFVFSLPLKVTNGDNALHSGRLHFTLFKPVPPNGRFYEPYVIIKRPEKI